MNALPFWSVVLILPVRFTGIVVERSMESEFSERDRLGKTFPGQVFLLLCPASVCAQKSHRKHFIWQVDLFCFAILVKSFPIVI